MAQTKTEDDRIQETYDDEFNKLTGARDMKKLDKKGDAIVRNAEANPQTPDSGKTPAEKNLYNPSEQKQRPSIKEAWNALESPSAAGKAFKLGKMLIGSRKGTGGILVFSFVIIALIAVGIFSLSPWKIISIVNGFGSISSSRIEHIFGVRAEKQVIRVLMSSTLNAPGDPIITGKGLLHDVYANFKTNKFETKLADMGLKFEKSGSGVKLVRRENFKWVDVDGGKVFKDADAIQKVISADKLTNKMLKQITSETFPAYRFAMRAKVVSWLRIKYGIKRFGLPDSLKKTTDPTEAAELLDNHLLTQNTEIQGNNLVKTADKISELADPDN
ncbi:hypothetical protein B7Z28_01280, partial [Candidatus Saccharibacteria bacterium 32-45-3]